MEVKVIVSFKNKKETIELKTDDVLEVCVFIFLKLIITLGSAKYSVFVIWNCSR